MKAFSIFGQWSNGSAGIKNRYEMMALTTRIILIFAFNFQQSVLAAGAGKMPYDLECPEDKVVTATRTGPTCTARIKLDTDPTCSAEMAEELTLKQQCYLSGHEASCVLLAIGIGAAAGGLVGQRAKLSAQSLLQKASSKTRRQIQQVYTAIREERTNQKVARDRFNKILNEQTPRLTSNKYQSFNALLKAYEKARTGNRPNPIINEHFETVSEHARKVYQKQIDSEPNPDMKKTMMSIDGDPLATSTVRSRLIDKIKQIFPEESKALEKLADAEAGARQKLRRERQMGMKDPETIAAHKKSVDALASALDKNPKFGMLTLLYRGASDAIENSLAARTTRAKFSDSARMTVALEAVDELKAERQARTFVRRGVIRGGVFGAVVGTAELASGQIDLRACRDHFGLNDDEIKYLGNDSIFTVAKAHKQGGWTCDSLALTEPEQMFSDLELHHNGIPKGICKIAQAQLKKLNELIDRIGMNPNSSCLKQNDSEVSQYLDAAQAPYFYNNEGKPVFEYREKSLKYIMPLRPNSSYPDFTRIKVFNSKNEEIKNQSLALQNFYNNVHPPNKTEISPELADISLVGAPNSANGNLFSNIVSAAFTMRVNNLSARGHCNLMNSEEKAHTDLQSLISTPSNGQPSSPSGEGPDGFGR